MLTLVIVCHSLAEILHKTLATELPICDCPNISRLGVVPIEQLTSCSLQELLKQSDMICMNSKHFKSYRGCVCKARTEQVRVPNFLDTTQKTSAAIFSVAPRHVATLSLTLDQWTDSIAPYPLAKRSVTTNRFWRSAAQYSKHDLYKIQAVRSSAL